MVRCPSVMVLLKADSSCRPFVYGLSAVVTFACTLLCLLMQESRPSQVLHQQLKKIAKRADFDKLSADTGSLPSARDFVRTSLWHPIRLFFTEPIVMAVSFKAATAYGIIYLFSEAFSLVYAEGFGMPQRLSSLVLLALAAGIPFTFLPRIYDIRLANRIIKVARQWNPRISFWASFSPLQY